MIDQFKVKRFKVVLLGLGNIGFGYDADQPDKTWTHYRAISRCDQFDLVGAVDPNEATRKTFEQATTLASCASVDQLTETQVDMVVIATPTEHHISGFNSVQILQPKLVLMEKPLTADVQQLTQLQPHADRIMVNLMRLYHPMLQDTLHDYAQRPDCLIQVNVSKGLLHNGIHFLSLLLKHFGQVQDVFELSTKHSNNTAVKNGKTLQFKFNRATAIFSESPSALDDNSMVLKADIGSFFYLNGGRKRFHLSPQGVLREDPSDELDHYQSYVYDRCLDVLTQERTDDSFDLAYQAQCLLSA